MVSATALDDDWQVGLSLGDLPGIQASSYMTCAQARQLANALLDAANHYELVRYVEPATETPTDLNTDTPAPIAPERDMAAEAREANLRG